MYSTRRWLRDVEANEVFAQDVVPTHDNIYLTTEYDILVIFEAVRQGRLPLIHRHLNERESINLVRPNAAFVFEEQGHIKRWTDGRAWSGTHRFGRVFMYFELEGVTMYESRKNGGPRARGQADDKVGRSRNRGLPPKVGGLHKYSYSALAFDPDHPNYPRKRYHITWYKSPGDGPGNALTVQTDPMLQTIVLPPNLWVGTDETPLPSAQSMVPFGDRTPHAAAIPSTSRGPRQLTSPTTMRQVGSSGSRRPVSPINTRQPISPIDTLQPISPIGAPLQQNTPTLLSPIYSPVTHLTLPPLSISSPNNPTVTLPASIAFPTDSIFPSVSPVKGPTTLPSFGEVLGRTGAPSVSSSRPSTGQQSRPSSGRSHTTQ
ncbi:hypothetical protein DACRYDRAFT_109988 [Dacryopinax primogenitus]|uniref:Gti1/Pac2 family-domain-containing protein n=1 Tax=Dacryopinax primogenitus (strain DJM 731) TaxID=1858805 RepID=M5FTB0_DACPD|nr:uncharacterized protein DACRYDRAFT_109988 [Dacryopinax primogenitus]EJT99268.1 hypothetical protein DACRYDRAFT_109988 [Dacryopinax primogenitus]